VADVDAADTFITMNGDYDITANFELIPPPPVAQRLIGRATAGVATMGGGYVLYSRFQAEESGTVSQIKVYSLVAGNAKVAIYADSSGEPGNKITGNDNSQACNASQWNTLSIDDTAVLKDTYYWIGVAIDTTGAASYSAATGGTARYKPITYGAFITWPSSAGTGFTNTGALMSLAGWGSIVAPVAPPIPTPLPPAKPITFNWTASAGATKYQLQVNTDSGFGSGTSLFDSEVTATTQVVAVPIGTTCYWHVRAGMPWSAWTPTGTVSP
jgi:hypothetical protein